MSCTTSLELSDFVNLTYNGCYTLVYLDLDSYQKKKLFPAGVEGVDSVVTYHQSYRDSVPELARTKHFTEILKQKLGCTSDYSSRILWQEAMRRLH